MKQYGPRLRLKRGMKIMQRDQSAQSCLLPYHCNSGFGKSIYIQLPLSLWRLILGGCGLIYEIKLVKIKPWALMVPFNMIFSLSASVLWCPRDGATVLHVSIKSQTLKGRSEESSNAPLAFTTQLQTLLKRSFDNTSCLWHNIPHPWCCFIFFSIWWSISISNLSQSAFNKLLHNLSVSRLF